MSPEHEPHADPITSPGAAPVTSPALARRRRRTLAGMAVVLAAAITFAVTAVVIASRQSANVTSDSNAATLVVFSGSNERTVPQVDLARLGRAGRFDFSAKGHQPFVINFFASWCPACQAELRAVATVANAQAGRVPFFGIDTNDTSARAAIDMLRRAQATYPVGVGNTTQADEFLVTGLPTTIFVNAAGKIVATAIGQLSLSELGTWVRELAAGQTPKPVS